MGNDGDNYNTKKVTVDTKEKAERIHKMCKELFVSCNNGSGGVGNSYDGESNHTMACSFNISNHTRIPYDFIDFLKLTFLPYVLINRKNIRP